MSNISKEERDIALAQYKIAENRRKEYGERIWRTTEYFTTLLSALLAIFFASVTRPELVNNLKNYMWILPSSSLIISLIAWMDVRREYCRQIEAIAEMIKAQRCLGLFDKKIDNEHLILERYVKEDQERQERRKKCKGEKEWITSQIVLISRSSHDRALILFAILFWMFTIFSIIIYLQFVLEVPVLSSPVYVAAIVILLLLIEHEIHTRRGRI